jgi:hypothetical protein
MFCFEVYQLHDIGESQLVVNERQLHSLKPCSNVIQPWHIDGWVFIRKAVYHAQEMGVMTSLLLSVRRSAALELFLLLLCSSLPFGFVSSSATPVSGHPFAILR